MRTTAGMLLAAVGSVTPIVARHDVPDQAYVDLAAELPVTAAVVRYSATDVAGTLIAPEWILSAAHVAETMEPGQRLITMNGDSVEVGRVVLHPGWVENGRPEDLALIELVRPIDDAMVAAIYRGRDEVGKEVVIIGNGDHGNGRTGPVGNDGNIRAATNLIDDATDAYLTWAFDDPERVPERATPLEGISGPGDSGGPAFVRIGGELLLAGISSGQSTSETGGREGRYGVTEYYTRVSTYHEWIRATISPQSSDGGQHESSHRPTP